MKDVTKLSKPQLQELVGEQTKVVARRDDKIKQLEAKIKQLENDYLKLWQERFAAKSERYIDDPDQLRMDFGDTPEADDAATGLADAIEDADLEPEPKKRRKPRKKRDESLPAHLDRKDITVDASDADKLCDVFHGVVSHVTILLL